MSGRQTSDGKVVIDGLDGFRRLEGKSVGTSAPVTVTQDMIERFCGAVGNTEWIHLDVERCRASPFGTTIAPGMLAQSLFSRLWFDMVDIRNVSQMLFMGSDRVRLLAPLKEGQAVTMTAAVDRVEEKGNGITVHLGLSWMVAGADKPVTVATFLIRYA
ncbi:MaoC/PaaZ C-terminal domain-containing protein [Azospirillum sp. ST 5-10]|uniref:MaoC/PaaZ C-terminal domain-containing protein n=1 Tax=unclassified Azospirillum TaxID=2630922 RepID=UPI003F49C34A